MAQPDFYFNPFDADFRANPYPHFPALLDGPPRQLQLFMPTTLIARYDDVVTVLHDHERFTVRRPEIPFRERIDPFGGAPTILTADPPVHSRLRRLVSKAFTPRRVRELEPRVREITNELLARATDSTDIEAMAALANPLPVIVIAEMLGVSAGDHAQFKQWSNDLISSFGQEMATGPSAAGLAAKDELRRYLADSDQAAQCESRRRFDQRTGHRSGRIRRAQRKRTARVRRIAVAGRKRNDHQSDRQRSARAMPQSRAARSPAREPRSDSQGDRGDAALRSAGPDDGPHADGGHQRRRHRDSRRQPRLHPAGGGQSRPSALPES